MVILRLDRRIQFYIFLLDPAIKSQDDKPWSVISKLLQRLGNFIRFLPPVEMTSYATSKR